MCFGCGARKKEFAEFFASGTGPTPSTEPPKQEPPVFNLDSWRLKVYDFANQLIDKAGKVNRALLEATDPKELTESLARDLKRACDDRNPNLLPLPDLSHTDLEEEIHNLAMEAVGHFEDSAGGAKSDERVDSEWPEPKGIDTALPSVPPLDMRLLPEALRPWIADIAERSQCPPDFLAVGAIVACASQVARSVAIRPKQRDDWTIVPNLWGGVIAPPGFLKSPALAETLKPLHRLAHDAALRYKQELLDYETECVVQKAKSDNIEQAIRSALKQKKDSEIEKLRGQLGELVSQPPHEVRTPINDTTVEKLGEILNRNPGGALIFRDELSGFLRSLERQGHEVDRAFYCEAWNGTGRFSYDRIGRGTIHIARTCVSILGGIQPGPWRAYLREAFQDGCDDGFVSRFQLLVWPDVSRTWRNVDRWPDTVAKETAWRIFSTLDNLTPSALGCEQAEGSEIGFLRFAADAQSLFDEWRADLEAKLRREEEHPILISHLAKYRKLMPAIALLLHAIACVEGSGTFDSTVSLQATIQAAAWSDFLEAHARRCYQSVTDATNTAAGALALKIRGGKLANPFRARDVYRAGWAGLSEREDAYRAIAVLEAAGWLRPEDVKADRGMR